MPEAALRSELVWPHSDLWVEGIVKFAHDCEQVKTQGESPLYESLLWRKPH